MEKFLFRFLGVFFFVTQVCSQPVFAIFSIFYVYSGVSWWITCEKLLDISSSQSWLMIQKETGGVVMKLAYSKARKLEMKHFKQEEKYYPCSYRLQLHKFLISIVWILCALLCCVFLGGEGGEKICPAWISICNVLALMNFSYDGIISFQNPILKKCHQVISQV